MPKILVVEDEEPIQKILRFAMEREGYQVISAEDGVRAVQLAREEKPDLVLLDLMIPEKDGFEVCRELREFTAVPIIMLTARDAEVDKILGLELGADDYVTKPFSTRELLARVKATLRRVELERDMHEKEDGHLLYLHDIVIDLAHYEVRKNGTLISLTHREFQLLAYLASRPGLVYTREQLLTEVWGMDYVGDERTVDVTIRRLREKLEEDASAPEYVLTRRGVGYYARR
ncbi:response regulator [Alicyclobacillus tolerans]|uniref:Two-component system response regulator VicR n=1 Tax=Alicyclobacillus tolerans TaxID=90970 RepID=A0ABT9LUD3_9BACL|nr:MULTISPECIES: response regulator [Alicyclobacillus]MDP9727877.1 two-component system response regulator VicR [Alicyclobacillus tengchongensis]QRF24521.1 response regulator transcription factor [Alicyclobacillus sp. TC]